MDITEESKPSMFTSVASIIVCDAPIRLAMPDERWYAVHVALGQPESAHPSAWQTASLPQQGHPQRRRVLRLAAVSLASSAADALWPPAVALG